MTAIALTGAAPSRARIKRANTAPGTANGASNRITIGVTTLASVISALWVAHLCLPATRTTTIDLDAPVIASTEADTRGRDDTLATAAQHPNQAAPHPDLHMTAKGLHQLLMLESQRGVTEHLHWPGGASGVTLGAGYDMKERTPACVFNDLTAIGVAPKIATTAAQGAGLQPKDAAHFAHKNHKLLKLTTEQQQALLARIIPHYEVKVRDAIHVPVTNAQFDSLVSIAYNAGGSFQPIADAINNHRPVDAAKIIKTRVYSHNEAMPGLVHRRAMEAYLLLAQIYRRA